MSTMRFLESEFWYARRGRNSTYVWFSLLLKINFHDYALDFVTQSPSRDNMTNSLWIKFNTVVEFYALNTPLSGVWIFLKNSFLLSLKVTNRIFPVQVSIECFILANSLLILKPSVSCFAPATWRLKILNVATKHLIFSWFWTALSTSTDWISDIKVSIDSLEHSKTIFWRTLFAQKA